MLLPFKYFKKLLSVKMPLYIFAQASSQLNKQVKIFHVDLVVTCICGFKT